MDVQITHQKQSGRASRMRLVGKWNFLGWSASLKDESGRVLLRIRDVSEPQTWGSGTGPSPSTPADPQTRYHVAPGVDLAVVSAVCVALLRCKEIHEQRSNSSSSDSFNNMNSWPNNQPGHYPGQSNFPPGQSGFMSQSLVDSQMASTTAASMSTFD